MNFKITIGLLLGSILTLDSVACSCDKTPKTKEEYSRSGLVIEGKIISSDTLETTDEILLRFKVLIIEDFKTNYQASDTIYVLTSKSISGCGYPFIPTQDYLIYADRVDINAKKKKKKEKVIDYKVIDYMDRTFVTSSCRLTQMSNDDEKKRLKEVAR